MKIYIKVGIDMEVTEEELERLKNKDEALFREKMAQGQYSLRGDTYLPEIFDNEEYPFNNEENYFELLM